MAEKVEDIANRRWAGLLERRRKKKVIIEWKKGEFVEWFKEKYRGQDGKCFYCGLSGKVSEHYEEQLKKIGMWRYKGFRKGKRGKSLEVDRKESAKGYGPNNCELVCYPCNNAKSDVFNWKEFIIIGAVIGALKKKDKLKKLKNNKFIQGLINEVTEATGRKI